MTVAGGFPVVPCICAGVALALASLTAWALRVTSQVPRGPRPQRLALPLPLWGAGRTGEVLGHLALPLLPARFAARWSVRLRQAELERSVSLQQWLGARMLYAAALAMLTGSLLTPLRPDELLVPILAASLGYILPGLWLHDRIAGNRAALLKELPAYLDLLTLAIEAGGSLTSALRMAVEKAPPSLLRRIFERVLNDIRSGRSRLDALAFAANHFQIAPLSAVTTALIQAESSGMSLGGVLRGQAEQRLNERFAAAEKLAMQAPVKMLGPLILCIFPCTFIVIGFPIAVRLMEGINA